MILVLWLGLAWGQDTGAPAPERTTDVGGVEGASPEALALPDVASTDEATTDLAEPVVATEEPVTAPDDVPHSTDEAPHSTDEAPHTTDEAPHEPAAVSDGPAVPPSLAPPLSPRPSPRPAGSGYDTGVPWWWLAAPPTPSDDADDGLLTQLLPWVPRRGWTTALGLGLLAALSWLLAEISRALGRRVGPSGLLPTLSQFGASVGRGGAVLLALGALVALRPAPFNNVPTFVVIGAALAVGWSLREALPDLVAWVFIVAEGRVRRGIWLRTSTLEGRVAAVGLRTTTLADVRGENTAVPNRTLLTETVRASSEAFTEAEVHLQLPGVDTGAAREAVREAVLLSPWIAPRNEPEIGQDPEDPRVWVVRIRLLDGRFRDRFEGTLPARVREVLATRRAP